jgi:hypothetical protein
MTATPSNFASSRANELPDAFIGKDQTRVLPNSQSIPWEIPDSNDALVASHADNARTAELDRKKCSQVYLFELSPDLDRDDDDSTFSLYSDGIYNEGDDLMSDISGPQEDWEENDTTFPNMNIRAEETPIAVSYEYLVVGTTQLLLHFFPHPGQWESPSTAEMGTYHESIMTAATKMTHVSGLD